MYNGEYVFVVDCKCSSDVFLDRSFCEVVVVGKSLVDALVVSFRGLFVLEGVALYSACFVV